jgi:hypothetical protein
LEFADEGVLAAFGVASPFRAPVAAEAASASSRGEGVVGERGVVAVGQAAPGTRYLEFDVPQSSLSHAGKEGRAQISGPNSMRAHLALRRGDHSRQFPPASNTQWIASRIAS